MANVASDIALELARKICKLIDSHTEWSSPETEIAALLRPHVWAWIPVGERLPEIEHGWFLVYETRANGEKIIEKTYWCAEDGWGTLAPRVTHWAALPSAPASLESSDQK